MNDLSMKEQAAKTLKTRAEILELVKKHDAYSRGLLTTPLK